MRVVLLIVIFLTLADYGLFALPLVSVDSTTTLDEVVVRNTRLSEFSIGTPIQTIDTSVLHHYRNQSMAELLSEQTAISVNTYGPGGLASISMRGGGSQHTAVIWNGFNLRNPMNAGLNFSNMPVCLFDNMTLQYGGASTLFGSGATTSSIHLSNSLKFNQGTSIALGSMAGSFNAFNQSAIFQYSAGRFVSATRFYYQKADNNFKLTQSMQNDSIVQRLKNAESMGYAVMQQNAFRISVNSILRSDMWYQNFSKNIPALLTDLEPGRSNQTDENLRMALNFAFTTNKILLFIRSGVFSDKIIYTDPLHYPDGAVSSSLSNINEIETKYNISAKHTIGLGANYTFESAEADDYTHKPKRQRISLFGSYLLKSSSERLHGVFNIRQEMVDGNFIPVVCSGGFDYKIIRHLVLKGNVSKNYMLPTFNNLYWSRDAYSAGNPALKPESGYSFEGGIKMTYTLERINLTNEITCYWSVINNWIIWLPDSTGIWKPDNYNDGKTKGIELKGSIETRNLRIKQKFFYLYTYVNAQMNEYNQTDDTYEVKDLLYVPKHKANLNYCISYRKYSFTTSIAYYGERYYDYLNDPLDSYFLIGISLQRNFACGHHGLEAYLKINNLTNTQYQVMVGYAMPPTNFMIGLNFKLNKSN